MLPAFDWAGIRVKVRLVQWEPTTASWLIWLSLQYYLDVSVIFGQDQVRARVPVRLS